MTVDILILGAGWTSTFLIPLCLESSLSYAATTRSGHDTTIPFLFDPESENMDPYKGLPDARVVLITFPIVKPGASGRLVRLYKSSRSGKQELKTGFIQLGSAGIWEGARVKVSNAPEFTWYDRHSPFLPNDRAIAETELLGLSSPETPTTVLNLAGLWGGQRRMQNWVSKVVPTKEVLCNKGSLHMIHGLDVSRAILAVYANFEKAAGERWILTDGRVYDWWDLASAWGSSGSSRSTLEGDDAKTWERALLGSGMEGNGPQAGWVRELMREQDVRGLPRNVEVLGRALDSREFWEAFQLSPVRARLEGW